MAFNILALQITTMRITIVFIIVTFIFCGCSTKKLTHKVDYLNPPGVNTKAYSAAVRVDNLLYLSGSIGVNPQDGKLVSGGVEAETKQVFENIKNILQQNNSNLDQVIKCTVFLADIQDLAKINELYKSYFKVNLPVRSTVAGTGLPSGARIEIDCIAVELK